MTCRREASVKGHATVLNCMHAYSPDSTAGAWDRRDMPANPTRGAA